MKAKIFAFVLLTVFLMTGFASALTLSSSNAFSLNQNKSTITLTNDLNESQSVAFSILPITEDLTNITFSLNPSAISEIIPGNSTTSILTATGISDFFSLGEHTTTLTATSTGANSSSNASLTISFVKDFCNNGNINASKVRISDIKDIDSDKEWEWKPRDKISINVKVKNQLVDDEDFKVDLAVWDTTDKDFVDLNGDSSLEQDLSINHGETETATFAFDAPLNLQASTGRYIVYVKSFVDGEEDTICNSGKIRDFGVSKALKISRDTHDIALDNIEAPETVSAGDTVTINAIAYNVGKDDETKAKVVIANTKLGLNQESTPFRIDADSSQKVEFEFVVPENTTDGTYTIDLYTLFNYDKNNDKYKTESKTTWNAKIKVVNGKATQSVSAASITAALTSDAKAGSAMTVKSTITNTGKDIVTYVLNAKGFESWADLNSIDERIFTLNAGQNKDVSMSFNVKSDAAGAQTFTIETYANGKTDSKQVAVTIAEKSSIFSGLGTGNTGWIYAIAAVNLILIILIIVVAVRISRR